MPTIERVDVAIIGAGQSGLSVGYRLKAQGIPFVILDKNERVGDSWRQRWDSLKLFTPAQYDGLVGMPFPAPRNSFPTKDAMADYLEAYAKHFALPVRNGVAVDRVSRSGDTFLVSAGDRQFEAQQVVVAMANYQKALVPPFARRLNADIVQIHSSEYLDPSQLRPGAVLIVGAGNSGAEIALELARAGHAVTVSGRDTGHVPFKMTGFLGRNLLGPFVLRFLFNQVLTLDTPIGRRAKPVGLPRGGPLIRVRPKDLAAAGVTRTSRIATVDQGLPLNKEGDALDVANVIWCTGFHPGFSWLDVPAFAADGQPAHRRGVSENVPGLYFIGLHFLYSMSSTMIQGAARDSAFIATAIAKRAAEKSFAGPRVSAAPAIG